MFKWFKSKFENEQENEVEIKNENLEENIVEEEITQTIDEDENLVEEIYETLEDNEPILEDEFVENEESIYDNDSFSNYIVDEEVVNISENKEENIGFFKKIFSGLEKTRKNFSDKINDVLGNYLKIDDEMYEEIEDILITSDVGVDTTLELIDNLKATIRNEKINDPKLVMGLLAKEAKKLIDIDLDNTFSVEKSPTILLVVGVNGVGKTTTIGKLASKYKKEGKKVLLVAADTFRAAATEQLQEWANRSGVEIIHQGEGSDPAAVVFDAILAAKARKSDVILCDTAGRLHNKANLMKELNKMYTIIDKNFPEANKESLIVLDATTGQNALNQARQFKEVAKVSGIAITKLDGTAKGGIILPLINELKVPVVYIGVGEKIEDLQPFNGDEFVDSIFTNESKDI